ncbi:MAG TPA: hypothetical protein VEZ55_00695 [Chitinophagaceae bacterium]|nr:hypothetical protein [Chitinophagaceae bacterium]
MTTLESEKNFSDGVAYGLAAGRAILTMVDRGANNGMLHMNVADLNMNSYLYDANDSKVIWQTYRRGGTDLPSRADDLVQF